MSGDARCGVVQQDVNSAAAIDEAPAAALGLLDENEIVELSVKPSLWFIVFVSARFLAVAVMLAIASAVTTEHDAGSLITYLAALAVLAAVVRLIVASLQWASRVYVLTNRRVMRFSGVASVEVLDCGLKDVARANMELGSVQRMLRLGTIRMAPGDGKKPTIGWEHVARAGDVYAKVVRAIKKAQSQS